MPIQRDEKRLEVFSSFCRMKPNWIDSVFNPTPSILAQELPFQRIRPHGSLKSENCASTFLQRYKKLFNEILEAAIFGDKFSKHILSVKVVHPLHLFDLIWELFGPRITLKGPAIVTIYEDKLQRTLFKNFQVAKNTI